MQMRPHPLQNHLPEVEYAGLNLSVFSISKTSHIVMIWSLAEFIVLDATNGSTLERDRRMLFVLGRSIDGSVTCSPLFRRVIEARPKWQNPKERFRCQNRVRRLPNNLRLSRLGRVTPKGKLYWKRILVLKRSNPMKFFVDPARNGSSCRSIMPTFLEIGTHINNGVRVSYPAAEWLPQRENIVC
jgi:hypothetical protein